MDSLNSLFYDHIYNGREPVWRGLRIVKMPTDLILYAMIIQSAKPKWIVECGTFQGGSSVFYQDMLDIVDAGGKVITIDTSPEVKKKDKRVVYIKASSTDLATVERVKKLIRNDPTMVILDSYHLAEHVKWELSCYAPLVTKGQFLVVEDCFNRGGLPGGPKQALEWFMRANEEFEQTNLDQRYIVGSCRGGWLRRIK